MNRQKYPNSKRAPTHKGVRLSSHLAQRARAEESLVDSDHDVGRLDDGDGLAAFLDGLEVPLIWLRAPIFMMRPFRLVRSRPHGSALLWWCRLSFGDTCLIACMGTDKCAAGRPPQPSSRFASFCPKGKIGGALLIDRLFLWRILRIKYFSISERMTILHNEIRRRSRERTKPSSA